VGTIFELDCFELDCFSVSITFVSSSFLHLKHLVHDDPVHPASPEAPRRSLLHCSRPCSLPARCSTAIMSDLDEFLEPADLTNGVDEEPTIISSPRARARKLPSRGKIAVDMDDVLW
jgi:hypothetical protein